MAMVAKIAAGRTKIVRSCESMVTIAFSPFQEFFLLEQRIGVSISSEREQVLFETFCRRVLRN